MTFTRAVKTCFSNYVGFTGRAPRSEFWWWMLFALLGYVVFGFIDALMAVALADTGLSPLLSIFNLATLLPSLAVAARRFHDMDRSGWWQLIVFIPIVGIIVMLIWLAFRGTEGPNRFGPDPLGATAPSAA
jgi:uncharacterized membrane protein YhaH (DUF805 family)